MLVGEVDNTRGDLDAALKAYKEAASTTEELLRRDPNNAQRIFDHAQSVFWVGYIAWQRGDAATAKKYFTQYKDYADQLVAIDPENDDWQMEEKYSLTNLGTLELDQGNAAGAEDHFRHALDISLALLAKKPGDSKRIFTAGQAHAWLAVAMVQELNFEGAKNQRLLEIALYQKAAADAPGDIAYLEPQAPAFRNLATIELYQGDLQAAKSYIMRGQSVSGALTDRDPSNTLWQEFAGRDAMLEGQINLFHGELGMARVALNKAVHIGNMLVSTKSDTVAWQRDTLSKAEILLARVAGKSGDKQEAARLAQKALRELQKLSSENDGDIKAIENKTAAIEVLVEIGMRPPQRWAEIVSMLAPIGEHAPPVAQARYAHALAALGRKEDARPIALRLLAAGYRHPDFIRLLNEHPTLVAER
ncbi:MAG: tetratricopeptide repeat protein [Parvularculaceae bacterium]